MKMRALFIVRLIIRASAATIPAGAAEVAAPVRSGACARLPEILGSLHDLRGL
jgi:predicted secreted protein